MEETIFAKSFLSSSADTANGWTESQYNQLKNQILAYKYLIRNMNVPSDILENIRTYEISEWEKMRENNLEKIQEAYQTKFENHDLSMKELAVYFKKRMKEQESIPRLSVDRNYGEDIEYNVDHEIESRKIKLTNYINHLKVEESNTQLVKNIYTELKLLKIYNIQKKIRKEVILNFVNDYDKQNLVYFSDMLFQKTLLDRRCYKKTLPQSLKKDQKINDRFEQQLRNGYDMRKKEKQREFLSQVINYHRDFMEFHKDKRQKLRKRALQVKGYLENLEIKDQKEKDKKEKERIQFLKQNNMEEYLRMVKEAKDSRLVEFMNQTDMFLKEIEDKIKIQKEIISNIYQTQDKMKDKEGEEGVNEEDEIHSEEQASNDNPSQQEEENKEIIQIEEEKDEKMREKVYNSKNYYLSAHSHVEEVLTQPKMLKHGQLKSYQVIGLQWLVSLYINTLNGILADEMGLGKTIQTIALLCYIIEKKHNEGPFLIIAPLATISNWVMEFSRWAPDIKIVVYKGPPIYRRQLAYQIKNEKHKFNVVLTTYEYIMKDKYSLNKITWQYIIVDEGHRMKNYKSKFTQTLGTQFNSVYRLLLTGTPLQNNLSELWALLNFLLPKIFNSCDDFEKWFNQPFNNKLTGERSSTELSEEQQLLVINRLHTVLRPFLLRREKKDVEKELPSKTEFIIKLDLSAWQRLVYHQIKENGMLARDPTTGKMGNKALMNTMMQLRKICNHPFMFMDNSNPLIEHVNDSIYRSSGKFELLDRILPKLLATGHKTLIFSQMTHLMDILELLFHYKGIRYLRLDGNTKADDRGSQIEMFNDEKGEFKVFILSTRAGGLGLNLQAADTVVIFDSDWNPQMDIQAQDRAHRIGQKQKVKVLRLISKKTIEEGILEKAAFKKNLDEKIIRAGLYNVKYSEQERRKKLLDILKNEKEEEEEEDEVPDDTQLNEFVSRSDEEFKLFEQMDQERYEIERKDEKLKDIMRRLNLDAENMKHLNYRLLQDYEVPEWVKISTTEEKEDEALYGKGMRIRHRVNYRDDDDAIASESESNEEEIVIPRKSKKRKAENNIEINSRSIKKRRIDDESYAGEEDGENENENENVNVNENEKSNEDNDNGVTNSEVNDEAHNENSNDSNEKMEVEGAEESQSSSQKRNGKLKIKINNSIISNIIL